MTDQEIIRAVEGYCDICNGCELKPGCQTEPNFGCQSAEKQRRGQISPPCRLCGERTPIVFNIRLHAVPVCQACAIAITRQEVASRSRRDAETDADAETWRPFGTEPQDGTEFLACREDSGVLICWWADLDDQATLFEAGGDDLTADPPTHWIPLPDGPAAVDAKCDRVARFGGRNCT